MVVTDIDAEKVNAMVSRYGVKKTDIDAIYDVDCDIFCPCAMGAIINDETLNRLKCRIICGSANNQLKEEGHGDRLSGETERQLFDRDFVDRRYSRRDWNNLLAG